MLANTSYELVGSTTETVNVTFEPEGATNTKLNWVSSDESVVTVDENGVLTSVGSGTATVTVSTTDGSNISKTISVTVKNMVCTNGYMTSLDCCIKTGTCTPGTEVSVAVNSSDTYNFYVIADSGNELTLIMDSNLGGAVQWYVADTLSEGPVTALNELKTRTSGWDNVTDREYTIVDDTSAGYDDIKITSKARMLSYTEVDTLGLTDYLKDNLYSDENPDLLPAYLLSSAYVFNMAPYNRVYVVHNAYDSAYWVIPNAVIYGLRPVITMTK